MGSHRMVCRFLVKSQIACRSHILYNINEMISLSNKNIYSEIIHPARRMGLEPSPPPIKTENDKRKSHITARKGQILAEKIRSLPKKCVTKWVIKYRFFLPGTSLRGEGYHRRSSPHYWRSSPPGRRPCGSIRRGYPCFCCGRPGSGSPLPKGPG